MLIASDSAAASVRCWYIQRPQNKKYQIIVHDSKINIQHQVPTMNSIVLNLVLPMNLSWLFVGLFRAFLKLYVNVQTDRHAYSKKEAKEGRRRRRPRQASTNNFRKRI